MRDILAAGLVAVVFTSSAWAERNVEKNVVYGMYSGLALLLDVHYPATRNGYGIIVIPGSGWHAPQTYDARALKDGTQSDGGAFAFIPRLLDAGYTLFVVNHRSAPRFRYPAALEDVQRAVRYVRFHAKRHRIRADKIGAFGYSSGAHLAALLGVLPGAGDKEDPDPVNRVNARVQCVVTGATPTDLSMRENPPTVTSFIGQAITLRAPDPIAVAAYREASPLTHVASSSAPLLMLHGDADQIINISHAESMLNAMRKSGATVDLIRLPGGNHGFTAELAEHPEWPDVIGAAVHWFDDNLNVKETE